MNGTNNQEVTIVAASGDSIFTKGNTGSSSVTIGDTGIFSNTTWSVTLQSDGVNSWYVIAATIE
jgi:hypothetical protein